MMSYTCVRIEGGLLPPDIIENIHNMQGQKPKDFNLDSRQTLIDEITSAWSDARSFWDAFQRRLKRGTESSTTVTREAWVIPLLESLLGYKLSYQRSPSTVDGRTYNISHRAGTDESAPPVHIVGVDQELGSRPTSGRSSLSPHAMVQDYLNRTDHLWGIVTNGNTFRLLRDSSYFTRPSYVEFDLKQMLEGERLDEFIIFYRLAHRTRLPIGVADAPKCLLEQYYQRAIEQGQRIRDKLRDAVEDAIVIFAEGFLNHRKNDELRQKVLSKEITSNKFYQQILYLVYRLLFLMVAEERNSLTSNELYRSYFSITRLRELSDATLSTSERFDDLYLGLRTLFEILREDELSDKLGLPPLNGDLFKVNELDRAFLNNRDLLNAIRSLSYFVSPEDNVPRKVNYSALDVEELGSVYESLLDHQPHISEEQNGRFSFKFLKGQERKTTGSYYTRPELVNELINSALVPVIEDRLRSADDKEKALLSIKVCDPACGSGHFLLAAARRIGRELAKVRTGSDEPSPESIREAIRDVITHCIYGVDKNPLAVDLCKVALWMEGYVGGKPLTFLDHRICCGDSLVGVMDLDALKMGIPDQAYEPVSNDERDVAKRLKTQNRNQKQTLKRLIFNFKEELKRLKEDRSPLLELADDKPEVIRKKMELAERIHAGGMRCRYKTACDLWTSAFFVELTQLREKDKQIPTTYDLYKYLDGEQLDTRLTGYAEALSSRLKFFHWQLEFPEVFDDGGFDIVLCNPPWGRIELKEEEFFSDRDPEIANAPNASARKRLISQLREQRPELWQEYAQALHNAESTSKFLRNSKRFPLTGRGYINTYSVFAEHIRALISKGGRAGIVIPTGIATDDTNKFFFADLIESGSLISLYDFENRRGLFPDVHSSYKFCLITMSGVVSSKREADMQFGFFLTQPSQLRDEDRILSLTKDDFRLLNPNTRTCPVFRTRADADLTKKIYERVPVLVNETTRYNPWGIRFNAMFNMANDSGLFRTRKQMKDEGYQLVGNRFIRGDEVYLPLYEAKMIWQYDHRFGSYEGLTSRNNTHLPTTTPEQHADPSYIVQPWYWVDSTEVQNRLRGWNRNWLLGFRDVTNATSERTAIFCLIPKSGVGNSAPILILDRSEAKLVAFLISNFCSIVFDYTTRQKIGGIHMSFFFVQQLPVLPPSAYSEADILFIVPRVLELVYTSWDIKTFADDVFNESSVELQNAIYEQWRECGDQVGFNSWEDAPEWFMGSKSGIPYPPFRWDEDRRARIRAELDAFYAKLYGLTEEELRYILDPQDVYGDDFPGETFRVLKEKEMQQYGEYRTKRLILEAWKRLT